MSVIFLSIFIIISLISLLYIIQMKKETFNTSACNYNESVPCINGKKNMPLVSGSGRNCVLYKVANC